MNTSKRIALIQQLARALADQEPRVANFTLRQYRLPVGEEVWAEDPQEYFRNILSGAEEDILHEISNHLGRALSPLNAIDGPNDLWRDGYFRCFLSHTSLHKATAADLKAAMARFGADVFVAHEDIEPTSDWLLTIDKALDSCHILIALMTRDFIESRWTSQEVGYALGRRVPVVPIRAGLDPYGLIGRLQAITCNPQKPVTDLANSLLEVIARIDSLADSATEGAVKALSESPSFAEAKTRVAYLEKLKVAPKYYDFLKNSMNTNSQLRDAYGVCSRINAIVARSDPVG